MNKGIVSHASVVVMAPLSSVWNALVDPRIVKQYMFGTDVVSDWTEGGPIVWKGEYQGKKYEDKGTILDIKPEQSIQYTHFSPLSGKLDLPENYHTITIDLCLKDGGIEVSLYQDNNSNEESRAYTANFWQGVLEIMKEVLERK